MELFGTQAYSLGSAADFAAIDAQVAALRSLPATECFCGAELTKRFEDHVKSKTHTNWCRQHAAFCTCATPKLKWAEYTNHTVVVCFADGCGGVRSRLCNAAACESNATTRRLKGKGGFALCAHGVWHRDANPNVERNDNTAASSNSNVGDDEDDDDDDGDDVRRSRSNRGRKKRRRRDDDRADGDHSNGNDGNTDRVGGGVAENLQPPPPLMVNQMSAWPADLPPPATMRAHLPPAHPQEQVGTPTLHQQEEQSPKPFSVGGGLLDSGSFDRKLLDWCDKHAIASTDEHNEFSQSGCLQTDLNLQSSFGPVF